MFKNIEASDFCMNYLDMKIEDDRPSRYLEIKSRENDSNYNKPKLTVVTSVAETDVTDETELSLIRM